MSSPTAYSPPVYIFLALGLGFLGFLFVQYGRNAAIKRIVWPLTIMLLAFSLISALVHDQRIGWLPAAMMSLPFIFLYFRYTFCSNCGATITRESLIAPPKFCSRCGARLGADA